MRRGSMRIAAGCARSADHDAPGGLKPTPAMPGMGRLWGVATDVTSSGDDAGVVARRRDLTPIDPHNRSKNHRLIEPWGGSFGVVPWPTRTVVHHRPPDPRSIMICKRVLGVCVDLREPMCSVELDAPDMGSTRRGEGSRGGRFTIHNSPRRR